MIILKLLEEKRALTKLTVELIHERKAIASLCEAIEKRLNQIEEIENTISDGHTLSKTTTISKKLIITNFKDQKKAFFYSQ